MFSLCCQIIEQETITQQVSSAISYYFVKNKWVTLVWRAHNQNRRKLSDYHYEFRLISSVSKIFTSIIDSYIAAVYTVT